MYKLCCNRERLFLRNQSSFSYKSLANVNA